MVGVVWHVKGEVEAALLRLALALSRLVRWMVPLGCEVHARWLEQENTSRQSRALRRVVIVEMSIWNAKIRCLSLL